MTVKELIKELKRYPKDYYVELMYYQEDDDGIEVGYSGLISVMEYASQKLIRLKGDA